MFVFMQLLGAALAVGAVLALNPDARAVADNVTHLDAEHHGGDRLDFRSAGSERGDSLNPVVQVLEVRGLSVQEEAPKLLTYDGVQEADVVITMGCGETCSAFPGKTYEDWQLDDPEGQGLTTVQRIVAEIDERVQELLSRVPV